MHHASRRPAVLVLLAMVASLLGVITPTAAQAAESIPTLKWSPAATVSSALDRTVTAPNGDATVPCTTSGSGSDLTTYNSSGQVVRQLDHTSSIDGVKNCISDPVVDKNGTLYGVPYGKDATNTWAYGPNLIAYTGNTVKWKYPVSCKSDDGSKAAIGADGNIYVTTYGHLIGLTPDLTAGQTQPTKILDITIPNDCSFQPTAYKDGIMLRGQTKGFRFYSYNGTLLDQMSNAHVGDKQVNAAGQVFDYEAVAGSYTSISVSKYDTASMTTKWTTSASTPGANTSGAPNLYPMPGGGVAALITEQKMVGGIPASPTEWVKTLVVLNQFGTKTRSVVLPNQITQGTYNTAINVVSDTSGKLVVIRGLNYNTGVSSPTTVPAVAIGVYNPSSDSWTYQQILTGDMSKSGGPNGYDWDYSSTGVSIANGTLFIRAHCTNNCGGSYSSKLYAVLVTGLGTDYPRGAAFTTPTLKPYVALGDSFSSGQGAADYDSGTVTSTNSCYKSFNAYGRVLNRDPASPLSLTAFAACGGSITDNIDQSATYTGVPLQDTALNSSTKVVSLTIGGNDIGFVDVVYGCLTLQCDAGIQTARQKLAGLPTKLNRVYNDILTKAPNAKVYVLGYGPLLSESAPDCVVGDAPFGGTNRTKAINLLNDLNQAISDAVTGVGNSRIQYVNPTGTNSPFLGHSLCTSDPYFNPIIPANTSESFHPNIKGQEAYATLLAQYVS